MDLLKSDFLKVLMLFIILFSFTSGGDEAYKECKRGMILNFGYLRGPLHSCVRSAILYRKVRVVPYGNENYAHIYEAYAQDVNDYYWDMHNLVSAEGIELTGKFCKRLNEENIKRKLYAIQNPKERDCNNVLKPFENDVPETLMDDMDPTDSQEIRDSKLKKRILYNALYLHRTGNLTNPPYIHPGGTYGFVYLYAIADQFEIINGKDITPLEFCKQRHKPYEDKLGVAMRSLMNDNQSMDVDDEGPSY